MKEITISNVGELESQLKLLPDQVLFRGQNNHYTMPDGSVSMPTSFHRHGCVPPLQLKWSHYANFVLRALSGSDGADFDLHLSQAVLQHYGWRSFFTALFEISCTRGGPGKRTVGRLAGRLGPATLA